MPSDNTIEKLLSVTYRPDLDVMVGRWGCQPEVEQLPAVYAHLKEQAMACGCRAWLQDIRSRTLNDPHITQWLLTEYFPQMARQLGGRLVVAYLTSPTLMNQIVHSAGYRLPSTYNEQPFGVAFFGTEGESLAWLESERNG